MKDKTLYWILGIIAAYFLVKFIINQSIDKKQNKVTGQNSNLYLSDGKLHDNYGHTEGDEGPTCAYCGGKTYYSKSHGGSGQLVLKALCPNPNCPSQSLCW